MDKKARRSKNYRGGEERIILKEIKMEGMGIGSLLSLAPCSRNARWAIG